MAVSMLAPHIVLLLLVGISEAQGEWWTIIMSGHSMTSFFLSRW